MLEAAQRRQQQEFQRRMQRVQQLQEGARQTLSRIGVASEQEQQRLVQEIERAGIQAARVRAVRSWGLAARHSLNRVYTVPLVEIAVAKRRAVSLGTRACMHCQPAPCHGNQAPQAAPACALLQLAGFLSAQLQAAAGEGGSEDGQLRALLRLVSMPLSQLARQAAGAEQLEAAGDPPAATQASRAEILHALAAVLEGKSRLEYRLPKEIAGGASVSRHDMQDIALATAGSRDFLSLCSQAFEQAGLGEMLHLLSAGDAIPAELPAQVRPRKLSCMPGMPGWGHPCWWPPPAVPPLVLPVAVLLLRVERSCPA